MERNDLKDVNSAIKGRVVGNRCNSHQAWRKNQAEGHDSIPAQQLFVGYRDHVIAIGKVKDSQ